MKQKQDIQKTSKSQLLVLLAFIAFIFLIVNVMHDKVSEKPHALFGNNTIGQSK
jgi:hypothetical protein